MITLLTLALLSQTPEEKESLNEQVVESGLTDAAISKMSGDQVHDVLRHSRGKVPDVAIVAVTGFYFASTIGLIGILVLIYRVYRQRGETLRLMVEKGVPIPPELISPKPRPAADLRRGVVLTAFGLSLAIFLLAVAEQRGMWTLGLVPTFVGIGYLIAFRLTKDEPKNGDAPAAPAAAA